MSSVCHIMKSGWITANAPLRNGVGRFMPQLARITIKFCKVGIGPKFIEYACYPISHIH